MMDETTGQHPVMTFGAYSRRQCPGESNSVGEQIADPLFILSPPRSFSSVVCAMLGQHPQMYGLPETHLFEDETMHRWLGRSSQAQYPMADGLLRAIAQLLFGEQTEMNVKRAAGWLRRRSTLTSGVIFEELARRVYPSIPVDKSPSTVHTLDSMHRVYRLFPKSRFIHLVRHPRSHGESVLKYAQSLATFGPVPAWLSYLASFPYSSPNRDPDSQNSSIDPQRGWYVLNTNIVTFLRSVPDHQWLTIRGEDLLADPDGGLREIARWLDLRADSDAIEEMKHPERSPYACFGPPGARFGNDLFFLENPALQAERGAPQSLEGPLRWRPDGQEFLPEVKDLARSLGYQ